jgi:hypothetical protein
MGMLRQFGDDAPSADVVILGSSVVAVPGNQEDNVIHLDVLLAHRDENRGLMAFNTPNVAFGIGMSYLFSALDFIRLGSMPWDQIIIDAMRHGAVLADEKPK